MGKIYLVERTDGKLDYDEYDSFVVVAKTPTQARDLCTEEAADEGEGVWFNAKTTIIGTAKDSSPRIILGSFNAG